MTWNLIELWETWYDINGDGAVKELSAKEKLLYNEEKKKLLVEYKKKRADIEAEAVKIAKVSNIENQAREAYFQT
ncbi:hypothetical protein DL98DRAFT_599025 [Cadophora sp. DSE1049]|nr:hypothetical protein DL98DRAFT_599025 [Cadophora sp. DSE1049]